MDRKPFCTMTCICEYAVHSPLLSAILVMEPSLSDTQRKLKQARLCPIHTVLKYRRLLSD